MSTGGAPCVLAKGWEQECCDNESLMSKHFSSFLGFLERSTLRHVLYSEELAKHVLRFGLLGWAKVAYIYITGCVIGAMGD